MGKHLFYKTTNKNLILLSVPWSSQTFANISYFISYKSVLTQEDIKYYLYGWKNVPHMPKDSALSLQWIWSKLMYIYKSNLVFHASTENLQYISLKYDKLTRENLTYSANVGAVGVYIVLITNK